MTGLYPDAPEAEDMPFSDAAGRLLAAARDEADRLGLIAGFARSYLNARS